MKLQEPTATAATALPFRSESFSAPLHHARVRIVDE
jgi:hypothetical protein